MPRIVFAGADLVLPDRVLSGHALVVDGDRIADVVSGPREVSRDDVRVDVSDCVIVPGFIDVHVHGALGVDVLDGPGSVQTLAANLPRWGVTACCPTSIACSPQALDAFLSDVRRARIEPAGGSARVLPAHLESNFLSPEFRGAQPLECLRSLGLAAPGSAGSADPFSAREILTVIDAHRPDVGIVTLAPEIEGGLSLVRSLAAAGVHVSLGHSGATFDQADEAIRAGARQVTHLFNAMRPMHQREPGLAGAALASDDVTAEIIGDGRHVHPAMIRVALEAKGAARLMAVTDGTAGSGQPAGSRARLGGRTILVGDVAQLEDGTMAGSVATMDRVFQRLVTAVGVDLVQAAIVCATTPARTLGLDGLGLIAPGALADLTVLDRQLNVVQTWIGGQPAWPR